MSPYGSPWAFLFSILLSGKFLDTKVELCLQGAAKRKIQNLGFGDKCWSPKMLYLPITSNIVKQN